LSPEAEDWREKSPFVDVHTNLDLSKTIEQERGGRKDLC